MKNVFVIVCLSSFIAAYGLTSAFASEPAKSKVKKPAPSRVVRNENAANRVALPEFAYRQITVSFVQPDGKPVAKASVYGFCRELNLVWPRRDHEVPGRGDVTWDESFLGKTDANGFVKVIVPPGKWQFFAAGLTPEGTVAAGWTDSRERLAGEMVRLETSTTKHWTLCSSDGDTLLPRRLLMKPQGFPIWIPVDLDHAADSVQIELSVGTVQMWAEADATTDHPGFALAWGALSNEVPDGKIAATEKSAVVECKGGKGQAVLSWIRWENFGLQGEIALCKDAKVLLAPGDFTLAYRRPIANGLTAHFAGQFYRLQRFQPVRLDFDTLLNAGVDEGISHGNGEIIGQLYLVDGNGHLMNDLVDSSHKPVGFSATVTLNGNHFAAKQNDNRAAMLREQTLQRLATSEEEQDEDESAFSSNFAQTRFSANIGAITSDAGVVWDFTAPPGILEEPTLTKGTLVVVTSPTFKMQVPKVLQPAATNLVAQAEILAQSMDEVSGRKRRRGPTAIGVSPTSGAVAAHDGSTFGIGAGIFYRDQPLLEHTFAHELAHNFDFHHGGMMESVVELCRCADGEQISQQPAKWLFLDLMNGLTRKKTGYKNTGLYLYCYAQAGPDFLHFVSVNEPVVLKALGEQNYTVDEITDVLCTLGLGRDMTPICRYWGLAVTSERVAQALPKAQELCRKP